MTQALAAIERLLKTLDSLPINMSEEATSEEKGKEEKKVKAVVCGGINIDRFIEVNRLPVNGETILGSNSFHGVGGKAANTAVCCAKMGASTNFIGAFGDDIHTSMLESAMKEYNVSTQHCFVLKNSGIPCGQAYIFLLPNGDNSIVVVPAANNGWNLKEMNKESNPKQIECIESCDCILLQREVSESYNLHICKIASNSKNDMEIVLDAGGEDSKIDLELFKYITIFSPNETELERLIKYYKNDDSNESKQSNNESDMFENVIKNCKLIQQIVSQSEKSGYNKKLNILAKLGSKGCVMVDCNGNVYRQAAMKLSKDKVVDTTGAGDTFTGAFAIEYMRQKKSNENGKDAICNAMKYACCAAGLSVQVKGTLPSIPDQSTVTQHLKKW